MAWILLLPADPLTYKVRSIFQ